MAKIAILNDSPEVVALMALFVTRGRHEFLNRIGPSPQLRESLTAFRPDLILLPMHRQVESIDRPIADAYQDIFGLEMYRMLADMAELKDVPLILFGIYVRESDLPESIRCAGRYLRFLEFPIGLQELNPLISGLVGPAAGGPEDVHRVREF